MAETVYAKYVAISVIIIAVFSVAWYNLRQESPEPAEEIHSSYKIAFSMIVNGNEDIYLVDTEGNQQKLTTSNGNEFLPSWSPDRSKIAFVSTQNDTNGEIYVMNADGSSWQRLTNDPAVDTMPVWSKDGTKIAFLSSVWSPSATKGLNNSLMELYVMDADGSNKIRITNTQGGIRTNLRVQWLSDSELIFAHEEEGKPGFTVSTVDINGNVKKVSQPRDTGYPVYSPDRRKIAFVFGRDVGTADLYVTNVDGSNRLRLTDSPMFEINPDWSPDGKAIVFAHLAQPNSGTWEFYNIGSNGCCLKKLAGGKIPAYHFPAWSK